MPVPTVVTELADHHSGPPKTGGGSGAALSSSVSAGSTLGSTAGVKGVGMVEKSTSSAVVGAGGSGVLSL